MKGMSIGFVCIYAVLAVLSINAVMAMCLVAAGENAAEAGRRGTVVVIAFQFRGVLKYCYIRGL